MIISVIPNLCEESVDDYSHLPVILSETKNLVVDDIPTMSF